MALILIFNGFPQSGKTTVQNIIKSKLGDKVKIISTIDYVKDVATYCGWNGEKTPENRKFLSDLKRLLAEWNDSPFQRVKLQIDSKSETIYLVDCREAAEIERWRSEMGAYSVLVDRPSAAQRQQSNRSDNGVFNGFYDFTIMNYGSLDELELEVSKFLEQVNKIQR